MTEILPFDRDAAGAGAAKALATPAKRFSYVGWGMTQDGFARYVAKYNFGSIPPDYIVLHHTATPGTVYTGA